MESLDFRPLIAVALVCAAAVLLCFRVNAALASRHKKALEIAGALRKEGLRDLPNFLEDFAVNDLVGMERSLIDCYETLINPAKRAAEFEKIFVDILIQKWNDQNQRPLVRKLFADLEASSASGAPASALQKVTADLPQLAASSVPSVPAGHTMTIQGPPSPPPIPTVAT